MVLWGIVRSDRAWTGTCPSASWWAAVIRTPWWCYGALTAITTSSIWGFLSTTKWRVSWWISSIAPWTISWIIIAAGPSTFIVTWVCCRHYNKCYRTSHHTTKSRAQVSIVTVPAIQSMVATNYSEKLLQLPEFTKQNTLFFGTYLLSFRNKTSMGVANGPGSRVLRILLTPRYWPGVGVLARFLFACTGNLKLQWCLRNDIHMESHSRSQVML